MKKQIQDILTHKQGEFLKAVLRADFNVKDTSPKDAVNCINHRIAELKEWKDQDIKRYNEKVLELDKIKSILLKEA